MVNTRYTLLVTSEGIDSLNQDGSRTSSRKTNDVEPDVTSAAEVSVTAAVGHLCKKCLPHSQSMSSSSGLAVTLTHGSEKHKLQLVGQEENDEPTVQDMALSVEQVTGVPIASQKLIFKGKSLKEMEQTLSSLGIKNGCKVMLIGKKNCPEEDSELKKLRDLEKSVEQMATKLDDVNKELSGIQKGFLNKTLQVEALGKLDKRIKSTVEQFMKILEQIDAMTMPDNFSDCRMKRKGLVKKVQGLLAQCDTVEGNISQEMDKLQCAGL
ncbi:BAG family molecular chaperone regulator 1 isoform X1 [Pelobates cultripes]|uniref:BAG family molecular chaperone regulator 1 n=1 Tax=Pelobates cultripes TaxID=61616 RepID=A0AAD1RY05_PELCU|nr:BAG family molecular chaperone regulator 1 isoform X1 [Pelobates cultripes]